ncbi:MAG: ABC transporter permease [Promethearchaeota archaeon]
MHFLKYILSNIKYNRNKYLIIILGITFGISSFIIFAIFSNEYKDSLNKFYFMDDQTVFVMEKDTVLVDMVPVNSKINENLTAAIQEIPGVITTTKFIFGDIGLQISTDVVSDKLFGIEKYDINMISQYLKLEKGRWFNSANEIVIGFMTFGGNYTLNDIIEIKGQNFTICGILSPNTMLYNHFVYMEYDQAQKLLGMQNKASLISVLTTDSVNINIIKTQINSLDSSIIAFDSGDISKETGSIMVYIEMAELITGILPLIILAMFFFTVISFIIRSRNKEFAILRVLGCSSLQLVIFIFLEVFLITLVGFLIGLIGGYFLFILLYGYIQNYQLRISVESFKYYFTSLSNNNLIFEIFIIISILNIIEASIPILMELRKSPVKYLKN